MSEPVRLLRVEAEPIAVVRRCAPLAELPQVMPAALGEVWTWVRARPAIRPGRNLAIYYDRELNFDAGVEVDEPFEGDQAVRCGATPAGMVVTATHIGPYAGLRAAHQAVCDWCAEHELRRSGILWEVYGHWTEDEAQLRTDVYHLLAPIARV